MHAPDQRNADGHWDVSTSVPRLQPLEVANSSVPSRCVLRVGHHRDLCVHLRDPNLPCLHCSAAITITTNMPRFANHCVGLRGSFSRPSTSLPPPFETFIVNKFFVSPRNHFAGAARLRLRPATSLTTNTDFTLCSAMPCGVEPPLECITPPLPAPGNLHPTTTTTTYPLREAHKEERRDASPGGYSLRLWSLASSTRRAPRQLPVHSNISTFYNSN